MEQARATSSFNPLDELENLPSPSSTQPTVNDQDNLKGTKTEIPPLYQDTSDDFFGFSSSTKKENPSTDYITNQPIQQNRESENSHNQSENVKTSERASQPQNNTYGPQEENSRNWYQQQQTQHMPSHPQYGSVPQNRPVSYPSHTPEQFHGYPSMESYGNNSDMMSFNSQQPQRQQQKIGEEKYISYPSLQKTEPKRDISANKPWTSVNVPNTQQQRAYYPQPYEQNHFAQSPHSQNQYQQRSIPQEPKDDQVLQQLVNTRQMMDQVTSYFGKIMSFMENIDKRLTKLEGVTQEILDFQQAEVLQNDSFQAVTDQMSQLESDRDFAKKLQEQYDHEIVKAKTTPTPKPYVEETPSKIITRKTDTDEELARKLQEQFNKEAMEEEQKNQTPSSEEKSGVLTRWFGSKKKESEKEQSSPLLKNDYTQPPKRSPQQQQQMLPYHGSFVQPQNGYPVYRPGYQPQYYPVGHPGPQLVYYANMPQQPQNKK